MKAQVEYYFSKDNLKNDSFLLSKMDAQNTVAVSTILTVSNIIVEALDHCILQRNLSVLQFAKMKALTQDEEVVLDAIKDSAIVLVVNGRLKAASKPGRNTIILREIPADTPESDIREIFNYPGCKPITSIKSDIGDTWFVVMESEADAKDVVLDLKLKKRMFNGSSVKARLKSEAVANRSFYPTTSPMANNMYPVMYPFANASGGQLDMPKQFYNNQKTGSESESPKGRHEHQEHNNSNNNSGKGMRNDNRRGAGKASGNRDNNGRGGDSSNRKNNNNNNNNNNKNASSRKESSKGNTTIDINSMNFPPLPPQGNGSDDVAHATTTTPTTEDYTQVGYGDQSFQKYQIDDIINIVKNIKEAVLPETIRPTEHPLAMESSPNVDLLLRQRTFSIDETREQMQQGRPVQRDAVIAGAVDYNSVMYGDDQNQGSTSNTSSPSSTQQQPPQKKTGGSWAGMLKSSTATSNPEPTTSPGNKGKNNNVSVAKTGGDKPGPAKSESNKKSDGKKGTGKGNKSSDKKDGRNSRNGGDRNRGGRNDQKDKDSSGSSGPPLKWGDKPSFANVLKASDEGTGTDKKSQGQNTQRKQRPRSGSESSTGKGGGKSQPSADDSTWSKQQLPPLNKDEP